MKRLTILIVVLCILVMSVSPGITSAEDPEEDTPTELPAFGLTVSPGCEKILLSWQTYTDAKTVVVKRDGEQSAMFYSGETIWLDKDPSTESHIYQIEALDENKEMIAKSWEISAKSSCYDPDICKTELKYRLNSTDYWVNGSQKGPMDTPPEISFGRMFLVIRYVTQELGAELTWEGTEKKLTITTATGKIIDLWIGKSIAMVDGASVAIDSSNMSVAPYIKAGRTLLPMRFVASQLGASGDDDVVWNDETKTVTLKVFDPACPEPDISFLTVTDIDSTKWLVHCVDSARNPVEVLLDQEYSKFSATLKPGELVSVAGTPTRKNRDTIEIEARWIKLIEDEHEEITCLPIKSENGELTYQVTSPKNETEPPTNEEDDEEVEEDEEEEDEDKENEDEDEDKDDEEEEEPEIKDEEEEEGGEEPEIEDEEEEKDDEEEEPISETQTITLKYNKSFTEIESSVDQYWVRIIKKGDSEEILWWEPIIFSATGEDIEQSNHSVSIGGIDTKKNRIKVSFDDGLEIYNDWVYFPIGFDLEDIDQTNCQKITFHKNYLGNRVAEPSAEEAACTAPYKLLSQSDSMLFYPGAKGTTKFTIKNLSEETADFQTHIIIEDANGERVLESKPYTIKPKYNSLVLANYSAPKIPGDFKVGLRVESGVNSRTLWIPMKCEPVDFDLQMTKKKAEFHLNEPIMIKYSITHKFDCVLKINPTWEASEDVIDMPSYKGFLTIPPGKTEEILFPTFWTDAAKIGTSIELKLGGSIDDLEKFETIELLALDYIPPDVFVSNIDNDEDKITTLYGSVNWNRLKPDRIVIDWGDGKTSEGTKFPFDHKYSRWDDFTITVKAYSKEGSIGTYSESYNCKEPPVMPPVIRSVTFNPEMPREYTLEITVGVNWRKYSKGNIHIDWGDGKTSKSKSSKFTHTFPRKDFRMYVMIIKATTKDGVESETAEFLLIVSSFLILGSRVK